MVYVQSNSLLSTMLAEREWNQYALHRKPLRVTSPVGVQRSSYFISVPWKFSIPMLAISWALHFAFSQGVFLVVIENIRGDGTVSSIEPTVAFSIWAIITGKQSYTLHINQALILYSSNPSLPNSGLRCNNRLTHPTLQNAPRSNLFRYNIRGLPSAIA